MNTVLMLIALCATNNDELERKQVLMPDGQVIHQFELQGQLGKTIDELKIHAGEEVLALYDPPSYEDMTSGGYVVGIHDQLQDETVVVHTMLIGKHLYYVIGMSDLLMRRQRELTIAEGKAERQQRTIRNWQWTTGLSVVIGFIIIGLQQWRIHWTNSQADPVDDTT